MLLSVGSIDGICSRLLCENKVSFFNQYINISIWSINFVFPRKQFCLKSFPSMICSSALNNWFSLTVCKEICVDNQSIYIIPFTHKLVVLLVIVLSPTIPALH